MRPALYPVLFGNRLRPVLDLLFTSGTLDSRITFSRGSLATLTNSAGNVAYAPHNLALWSNDWTNAAWGKVGSTATSSRIQEDSSTGQHRVQQGVSGLPPGPVFWRSRVRADQRSKVGVEIAAGSGGVNATFDLSAGTISTAAATYGTGFSGASATIVSAGGGEYDCTVTAIGPGGSTTGFLFLSDGASTWYTGDGASGIYVSRAQLNVGPLQPYYPTTSAAYHGPRFTFDPITHASLGLLVEEQRTNLLPQSNSLSTTWSAFGAPGIAQNIAGIDGGTTGWTLTDSNAGSFAGVQQQVALSATTYTLSCYVKKTTGAQASYPVINADNTVTLTCLATIDTSNGVATVWTAYTGWTVATSSATCVSHNADYWRVTLTFLATAVNWNIGIFAAGTANATQSTGVLSAAAQGSAGFTCLQLEAGTFATSYIPTTSATVTRAADSATMTGANFSSWFNAAQGTFIADSIGANDTPYGTILGLVGVTAPLIQTSTFKLEAYDGTNLPITANGYTAGTSTKNACSYQNSGSLVVCLKGGAVASSAYSGGFSTSTQSSIGMLSSGANIINAPIARLRYYNTALTNAQLQALTT